MPLQRKSRLPQDKQDKVIAGLKAGKTHAVIAAEAEVSMATVANYSKLLRENTPAPTDTLAIIRQYPGGGSITLDDVDYLEDEAKRLGLTVHALLSLFVQAQDTNSKLYKLVQKLEEKA